MACLGIKSAEGLTGANCVRREGSQRRGVRDRRRTALRRAADRSQTLGDQIGSWLTSHGRAAGLSSWRGGRGRSFVLFASKLPRRLPAPLQWLRPPDPHQYPPLPPQLAHLGATCFPPALPTLT